MAESFDRRINARAQEAQYEKSTVKRNVWEYKFCPYGCINSTGGADAAITILKWAVGDDPAEIAFNLTAGKFVKLGKGAYTLGKAGYKGGRALRQHHPRWPQSR
jgi:hypothetical protein